MRVCRRYNHKILGKEKKKERKAENDTFGAKVWHNTVLLYNPTLSHKGPNQSR